MNKYLITGCSGFVGQYLIDYLAKNNHASSVLGIDIINDFKVSLTRFRYEKLNMLNEEDVKQLLLSYEPDYIIHCASISSVAHSWKSPIETFRNNTNIFLNLIESTRQLGLSTKILSIGSSEQYGTTTTLPLREDLPLYPASPYAVARVSQEMWSKLYAEKFGLNIYMTRSFNHFGPGQSDKFVVSSFVKQLVEIKYKNKENIINVGNIEVERDFLDVRDVVDAYYKILQHAKNGSIYNICSGKKIKLLDIINVASEMLSLNVNILMDKERIRPNDVMCIYGDNTKIKNELGWVQKIPFEKSIEDMIHFWRSCI